MAETVTILRPGATIDRYGNTVLDWGNPTITDAQALAIYPRTSEEDNVNRTAVIVGLTVLLPINTDVEPSDRMIVRGDTYEVVGEPGNWRSPWGWKPGSQVDLRRVDG